MKYSAIIVFFFLILIKVNSQNLDIDNNLFYKIKQKDLATFNDAIALIRLVFNENDNNDLFIENALWAAEKKLFRVTIPITQDAVNPIIIRKEFANWLCKIAEIGGKYLPGTKLEAYYRCVNIDILDKGRGPDDSFSGLELIETFSYFDYYIRSKKIKLRYEKLPLYQDNYDEISEWRKKLYLELDEQQKFEDRLKKEKQNKKNLEKDKDKIKKIQEEDIYIKVVE